MRAVNELVIRGPEADLARLREAFDGPLGGGWRRDTEAEQRRRASGLPDRGQLCFRYSAEGSHPAAVVWLGPNQEAALAVDYVLSLQKGGLTDEQAMAILADFDATVVRPAGDGLAIESRLAHLPATLESHLSSEAARRLKAFSETANRSTLRHLDRQRWHDFVVQCHLEAADFPPARLDRWLADQGWAEDQRHQLLHEYEAQRAVLATYDEERRERCLP